MAIRASTLPLFPSLSVGDGVGIAVLLLFAGVALALLHVGGRLRLSQLVGMLAIGALAIGYLIGLAASVGD